MISHVLPLFLITGAVFAADYRVTLGISQTDGQIGLGFDPGRILPQAGDTITFSWAIPSYVRVPTTGSYSATQGDLSSPCSPLSGGFDTGAKTTAAENTGNAPSVVFTVNDTQPLYFYSSVEDQCKKGMVLGVNTPATGSGSIEAYAAAAAAAVGSTMSYSGSLSSYFSASSALQISSTTAQINSSRTSTSLSGSSASTSPSSAGASGAMTPGVSTYEILAAVVIACIVGSMSDIAMC